MSIARIMMQAGGNPVGWILLLGSSQNDGARGVALNSSGEILACGGTSAISSSAGDMLIFKVDSSGSAQWARALGNLRTGITDSSEEALSIAVDSSDNAIIGGTSFLPQETPLAKYNSSGTIQWQKDLSGSVAIGGLSGVAVDSSDNIIVCHAGTITSGSDILVTKCDSSGNVVWNKLLSGSDADFANGIAVDSSDNIIVCGTTQISTNGPYAGLIAKYNSSGVLQWQKKLGGSASPFETIGFGSVALDSSNNIFVCGTKDEQSGAGGEKALIAKYNSSGTLQWQRTLSGTGEDEFYSVAVDPDGNVFACGYTSSDGEGGDDILIAKYNSSGTLLWDRTLGKSGTDIGRGVVSDSLGNAIFVGTTNSDGAGSFDSIVVKVPGNGSGTGSYGGWVYQQTTLTDAASSSADGTASLSDSSTTITDSTASRSASSLSLTEELIEIKA